jgi:hypothetical protein
LRHLHIDEKVAAGDSIKPALVDDLNVEAMAFEIMQQLERVAGLGEHVDVLGRPVDAGVARQRISPGDQERDLRLRHQLEDFRIEGLGRRRRRDQRWLPLERVHIVHGGQTGRAGRRFRVPFRAKRSECSGPTRARARKGHELRSGLALR